MSGFFIPRGPPSSHHPLREFLRTRDGQDFREGVVLTEAVTQAVSRTIRQRGLKELNVVRALVTVLVSFIQAVVPHEAWEETGAILADEIRARLTVEQD